MALVDIETYRDITGDRVTDSVIVTARIEEATDLIEEDLHRQLREDDYEERLIIEVECGVGYVYPSAYPITAIPGSSTYQQYDTVTLYYVTADPVVGPVWGAVPNVKATVNYTGGYTAVTIPRTLARCIARLARALACPSPVMAGISGAVRVGDVSATITGSGTGVDELVPGMHRALTPYRRRRRLG